ncbi:hypothetical protein FMM08_08205 [Quadrisphaera setariae]|uniref:Knr4/Smi1-like domain-containing protein n=2 Tax=Quadrisphaera setariae TaxID=2593304 RepID=A0A5C8ZHR4_9ACTN|nr:hypothetical protein FMM08_08205 [Quadrisphaera setariae]
MLVRMTREASSPAVRDGGDAAERVLAALERVAVAAAADLLLRPAATRAQLDAVEQHLGRRLPPDVTAFYLLHDGQEVDARRRGAHGLVAGLALLPLEEVLRQWDQWASLDLGPDADEPAGSEPEGFVRSRCWLPGWVPLTHDGSGNHVGLDLDPDALGTAGQLITFGADDDLHRVLAPSLVDHLERVPSLVTDLELAADEISQLLGPHAGP